MLSKKEEEFNETVDQVEEWFYTNSNILETCSEAEDMLTNIHKDNHMCPYFVAFIELARANMSKGWTKEELINNIRDLP